MKKIYSLLLLTITSLGVAQTTTIYSESIGVGVASAPYPLVSDYAGYQNSSPITYAGTADVRSTSSSTGYPNSSGGGGVFLGAVTTDNGFPEKNFIISGIDTSDYTDIVLSFGHHKGTNASSNEMTVEVSEDGDSWTVLTYSRPTGPSTSIWLLITPEGVIPSTSNLRIRFNNPRDSNAGFRVDDIKLTGVSSLGIDSVEQKNFKVYPTQIADGRVYVSSLQNELKAVKIFDCSSRLVLQTITQKEVNVSKLTRGMYILVAEANGKTETVKIVVQ